MIQVVNCKNFVGNAYNIGRPSIFGNKFVIGKHGTRKEVIEKYRKWLWQNINKDGIVRSEFIRLAELASRENINLSCFCKPKECHGDILAAALNWYIKEHKMALDNVNIFDTDEQMGGLITGFHKLDTALGELQDGIFLIKGKSGSGKTAFALQASLQSKGASLFITAEQSAAALVKRLIARLARISLTKITNKQVPQDDLKAALDFTRQQTPFLHIEEALHGAPSLAYIKNMIAEIREKDGATHLLIVIDSIDDFIFQSKNNYEGLDRLELAKKLAISLNDLAKEEKVTFLLTLQDNVDKSIEDIFTFASETFLDISWDKEGRTNSAGFKKSRITILKNRAGSLSTLFLNFQGDFQDFTD